MSKFVTIYNAQLDAYADVMPESVPGWLDQGWEEKQRPDASSPTPSAPADATQASNQGDVTGPAESA